MGPHTYRNNYFENCGIAINDQSRQTTLIMNNRFVNGTVSMVLFAQNISVTGCTFTKCNPGIYLSESSEALIKDNKFSYCKTGVTFGEGGLGDATYNTFSNCKNGILVYKGSANITNNLFTKNNYGIYISQEDRVYMNQNKYSGNKKNIFKEV